MRGPYFFEKFSNILIKSVAKSKYLTYLCVNETKEIISLTLKTNKIMQQRNLEYRVVLMTECDSFVLEDGLKTKEEAMDVIRDYKSTPGYEDSRLYYEKY